MNTKLIILLAMSFPLAAQPTISAFACAANGPSSVLCSWTTSVAADSKITATGTGGPYNTPVVHPFAVGAGWGVTAHSIAITGLPNNVGATAYSLTATSCTAGGCNTSSAVTSGTTAPLASQTFHLVPAGPMFRPTDQYDGRNGAKNTGYGFNGDTGFFTWAADGFDYRSCEDCYGVAPGYYSPFHMFKEAAGHTSNVDIFTAANSPFSAGAGCPGGSNCAGAQGPIAVRGSQYLQIAGRQGAPVVRALSGCSWTSGTVTCALTNTTTPLLANGMYATVTGANPSTYNTVGIVSGVTSSAVSYAIASNPGAYVGSASINYLIGCCSNVYKTNDNWATEIVPANNTGPGAVGTFGQQAPTWSYIHPAGVNFLIQGIQCDGKAYACTPVAGLDGWVYFTSSAVQDLRSPCQSLSGAFPFCLARMRIEDMPITVNPYWWNAIQWYKGTQTGDDGLYDVNWTTNYLDSSIRKMTGIPAWVSSWLAGAFQQSTMTFIGDPFNRFLFAAINHPCGAGASCSGGGSIYDLGQYPWASTGVPTLVGSFDRDVLRYPYSMPGFVQPIMSTYQKIDGTHAAVRIQGSGMGAMQNTTPPGGGALTPVWGSDNYTTWLRDYIITAGAPTVAATDLVGTPDLDWQFDSYTGDTLIHDHSGNNHTGTDDNGHPYVFDALGLWLYGFPNGATNNPIYGAPFRSSTTLTGFAPTYTTLTALICFAHMPGPPINAIVSPEIVIGGGNIGISRHLSTSTWDVSLKGTLIGAVPIAEGQVGCIAVRRDASNVVTVFGDSAIRQGGSLVPTAGPTTITGAWTATAPAIGGTGTSLLGIYSRLAFFSAAHTDAQLITNMEIIRGDLRRRGWQIQ